MIRLPNCIAACTLLYWAGSPTRAPVVGHACHTTAPWRHLTLPPLTPPRRPRRSRQRRRPRQKHRPWPARTRLSKRRCPACGRRRRRPARRRGLQPSPRVRGGCMPTSGDAGLRGFGVPASLHCSDWVWWPHRQREWQPVCEVQLFCCISFFLIVFQCCLHVIFPLTTAALTVFHVLLLQALARLRETATSWRRRWPACRIWSGSVRSCGTPRHARMLCLPRAGGLEWTLGSPRLHYTSASSQHAADRSNLAPSLAVCRTFIESCLVTEPDLLCIPVRSSPIAASSLRATSRAPRSSA